MSNSTSSVNTAFYITPKPKSNPHFNSTSSRFITFTSPNHRTNKPWISWRSRRKIFSTVKNVATDQQSVAAAEKEEQEIFDLPKAYAATAQSVRDELIANWNATYDCYEKTNMKQAYYLSMEFLQGRALLNAIGNLELSGEYAEALSKLGHNLEDVARQGRLASFLGLLATLNYPAWGYGLRYKYGLFKQNITTDGQEEMGHPWEIIRNDVSYNVKFYGKIAMGSDGKKHWVGGETIKALLMMSQYQDIKPKPLSTFEVVHQSNFRRIDLDSFNSGDHVKAFEAQANAEKPLYKTLLRALRGGQEALLTGRISPDKVAVQMNDTHPTSASQSMRILIDVKKWSLDLMQKLLPRHGEIIELVETEPGYIVIPFTGLLTCLLGNSISCFLQLFRVRVEDLELLEKKIQAMRILDNVELPATIKELVRMANLSIAGGHAVNGVAAIHSEIVKRKSFTTSTKMDPLLQSDLSNIITKWTGTESWVLDTEKLAELRSNKIKAASYIKEKTGYSVSPDAMFDVQYKRQLLNILGIVYRYKKMKEMSAKERKEKFAPPCMYIWRKAFATYVQAKRIVKFIVDVGATINRDSEIGDLFEGHIVQIIMLVLPKMLIPATELSQHIRYLLLVWKQSGTSNMKFSMNGCVLIGTLDGANVEIREEAHEITKLRKERTDGKFVPDPRFQEVKAYIRSGVFGSNNYDELMGSLEGNEGYGRADYFLVGKDFPSYIECQDKVGRGRIKTKKKWTRMSIMNTAGSYKFSSDRTIREYAKDIWNIEPVELP
ncbi:hypothetical protein MKW92_039516 [Papaver armeniacum]|nr:hypothetical protein MKW92_039516 [Papaver armeniacum]